MSPTSWAWIVLACPLVGMLVVSLGWRTLPGRSAGWIASAAILGSFVASVGALLTLLDRAPSDRSLTATAFTYASTANFHVGLQTLVDPLSVFMCLVVSGVSFLIHVYSVAYMGSDRGYARYFAYLNYFVFSMLLLVLAGNLVILIVGWAFVGAASYLLISFWYRRTTATYAGIKAFVINVVGDVGGGRRALEQRVQPRDQVHARGDHGGRVDQGGDRGGALHRVREPGMERQLR